MLIPSSNTDQDRCPINTVGHDNDEDGFPIEDFGNSSDKEQFLLKNYREQETMIASLLLHPPCGSQQETPERWIEKNPMRLT